MLDAPKREVTDHALVRYIERIKGDSLDRYRNEIRSLVDKSGVIDAPTIQGMDYEGLTFVIDPDGAVITTLLPGMRPKTRGQFRSRNYAIAPIDRATMTAEARANNAMAFMALFCAVAMLSTVLFLVFGG